MDHEKIKKIRLLLVDDEDDFRSTLAKRMKRRGVHVSQASNGKTCLAVMSKQPVDVVVLDVKMPGMSGIEVLQHIKTDHPQAEVIFLTGHAATRDGVEGIKSGAFDYLSKPIEFEHLLGKILQAYDKIHREQEKRLEADFKSRMEQQMISTERLAAMGTLAAGVAHEINNPLAIINEAAGFMSLVLQKPEMADMPGRPMFEMALNKIEKSIKRARKITHQLLGSVRKSEPVLAEADIRELVNETIQLVGKEAKNKDITVSLNADTSLNNIWIDSEKIRQVLINLLTNAIQSIDKQGQVSIHAKNIFEGILLTVSDTGPGVPRENREKIFEPFFSTKSPGEGTGLGLFVTKEIIEKMGGTIEIDSRMGHGTRFTVRIPNQIHTKNYGNRRNDNL